MDNNNVFIFAKSSALSSMQYHGLSPETILQSHIHEEELAFKAALSSQEKQINVQFVVLSIEFL